ncbi:hypothetical protein EON71_01200 [bacterium]|nr:MAG: hypothetical protein EON71_01200 [bacterium]
MSDQPVFDYNKSTNNDTFDTKNTNYYALILTRLKACKYQNMSSLPYNSNVYKTFSKRAKSTLKTQKKKLSLNKDFRCTICNVSKTPMVRYLQAVNIGKIAVCNACGLRLKNKRITNADCFC